MTSVTAMIVGALISTHALVARPIYRAIRSALQRRGRGPDSTEPAILSRWRALPAVERQLVALVADRLLVGLDEYGPLDLATDRRDYLREAREESLDEIVYRLLDGMRREALAGAEAGTPSSRPRSTVAPPSPPAPPAPPTAREPRLTRPQITSIDVVLTEFASRPAEGEATVVPEVQRPTLADAPGKEVDRMGVGA